MPTWGTALALTLTLTVQVRAWCLRGVWSGLTAVAIVSQSNSEFSSYARQGDLNRTLTVAPNITLPL